MHRTSRVGGNEFHHHTLAFAEVGFAVVCAVFMNAQKHLAEIAAADKEINEAGTGHFGALNQRTGEIHAFADRLGNLAGRHPECLCRDHRRIGGKVAVRRVGGRLNGEGGRGNSRKHFVSHAASHCRHDNFFDLGVYFLYGISHFLFRSFRLE